MKYKTSNIIYALSLFMIFVLVFEQSIYGRLNLSSLAYLLSKIWTELFLYGTLIIVFVYRLLQGKLSNFQFTKFDIGISIFILIAIFSTLINKGELILGIINVRTMLRYVSIYYIVIFINWSVTERQILKIAKFITAIAVFQSCLGVIQHFFGDEFTNIYFSGPLLESSEFSIIELSEKAAGQKLGAAIGTFGKSAIMALYLMLAATITMSFALETRGRKSVKWTLAFIIIVFGIFFTYKRSILLLVLVIPLIISLVAGHKKVTRNYLLFSPFIILLLGAFLLLGSGGSSSYIKAKEQSLTPLQSLNQLFSSEYWEISSEKSRGWVLFGVGWHALSSFKPIGYGADVTNAQEQLAKKGGEFSKLVGWGALDDVYVVANLVYFGPIGLIVLISCFVFLYKRARILNHFDSTYYRVLGISFCSLLILTFFASFVVRSLEFRSFGFCLWFLAGLIVVKTNKYNLGREKE